jgi:WD40 repeat protein
VTGGLGGTNGLTSAEVFDPVSGTFSATGSMAVARSSHTATLLNNGQVLVTGGGSATAELFDPASGHFTATGSMAILRTGQTATLLSDGRVLVTGGNATGAETATAELYNPTSGTFTSTGSMETVRWGHTATLLSDGRVLVAGGIGSGTGNAGYLASAEIFDPVSGAFTVTGSMKTKRWWHETTLLGDGRVLVSGGVDLFRTVTSEAELFDTASGTFTPTGSMTNMRRIHTSTLLNNGKILVTGGEYFVMTQALLSLATAEIFDPASGGFVSTTGNMATARSGHTATLLNDGSVLVTGGIDFTAQGEGVLASAELFK